VSAQEPSGRPAKSAEETSFGPLLLLFLAVLGSIGFHTYELASERAAMQEAKAAQAPALEQAQKLRAAADSLAAKTQKLANGGNADAQLLVTSLRQRGISINLSAQPLAPPP